MLFYLLTLLDRFYHFLDCGWSGMGSNITPSNPKINGAVVIKSVIDI